jgi:conjugative relaxase-like TrwC/TraI family protein
MLRVTQSVSAKGATRYFDEALARGDYYTEQDRSIGTWGGKAAERLGLSGQIQRENFIALASNLDPGSGERLTARTKNNRTAGYDFTFSVPKSVSVFMALEQESEVQALVLQAFEETMVDIEAEMKTRIRGRDQSGRQRDTERLTGNLAYAAFAHEVSRPVDGVPDPHFHIHCYVLNATYDEVEQRWKAGFFRDLKRDAPYWEAAFHSRVAEKLIGVGYGIRRTERDFELASVNRETIDKFSRRTVEIEELARKNLRLLERRANALVAQRGIAFGEAFAIVKAELGAKTREAKDKGQLDANARLARWESLLTAEERQALSREGAKAAQSRDLMSREVSEELAIEGAFERSSVVSQRRLEAEVLRLGIGMVLVDDVNRFSQRDGRLVAARDKDVTTRSVLEEERATIGLVKAGQGRAEPWDESGANWKQEDRRLNEQQVGAIRHLLSSPDQWVAIRGAAGTGKTTMMREAVSVVSAFGEREVAVFAPSAAATEVLRAEGFAAETFQMLMHSPALQAETAGKIVWIDEAGFLSSRQMLWLAKYAADHNSRVILTGDPHQHHAVERGDMLRILVKADAVRVAELTEIQRQTDPELRAAVHALSTGEIGRGFEMLGAAGRISEIEDDSERDFVLVQQHLAALNQGQSSLVVSPTHAEAQNVAEKIREALRECGGISAEERPVQRLVNTGWTYADRRDATRYQTGQVIEFHRGGWSLATEERNKKVRFNRGEQWSVVESGENKVLVERYGERAWLATSRANDFAVYQRQELRVSVGDTVRVTKNHLSRDGVSLLNNWRFGVESISENELKLSNGAKLDLRQPLHLDQGYAVTSHSSQGQTVDQVLVAAPVRSMDLVSAVMFYVGVSRARNHVQVFTDSRAALLEAVEENLGVRTAAVEATGEVKPSGDELRRRATQRHRRESRQREREETARKHEEARRSERNADKVILAKLFRSGRLGSGRDRGDVVRRARQLLSEFGEAERREFGPTLDRLIAASEVRPAQAKKTVAESLRARYERELAVRFAQRYPNPTPEQKTKIAARIRVLVERAIAKTQAAPETTRAKNVLVKSYERGLMERASKKLGGDLTPALEQVLAKRIQAAGHRYWDRLINLDERTPAWVGSKSTVGRERN